MKRIMAAGGPAESPDGKPAKQKEQQQQARTEERERQWRRVIDGYRAVVSEMKRVTWPSRDEWVSATLITVALVVTVAIWTSVVSGVISFLFKIPQ